MALEAATNTDIASLHVPNLVCVCVGVLCKTLSACITTEARAGGEQNPAGSE